MKSFLKKALRYFMNGIFVIAPFVITIVLILWPLNRLSDGFSKTVDVIFRWLLPQQLSTLSGNSFFIFLKHHLKNYPKIMLYVAFLAKIRYINILFLAGFITVFGIVASSVFVQTGVKLIEQIMLKIPGITLLYSYVKESTAAFVGKFDKPVLVTINKELQIQKIGFITQEHIQNLGIGQKKIAVYIPHSYALSGELFFVNSKDVRPLEIESAKAWKIILSGGIAEAQS